MTPKTYEEIAFKEFEDGWSSFWEHPPEPSLFSETTPPFDSLHEQRFRDALKRAIERLQAENDKLRADKLELEEELRKAWKKRQHRKASP